MAKVMKKKYRKVVGFFVLLFIGFPIYLSIINYDMAFLFLWIIVSLAIMLLFWIFLLITIFLSWVFTGDVDTYNDEISVFIDEEIYEGEDEYDPL